MSEYYKQAIDVLLSPNVDLRKVSIELAKYDPQLFVKLVNSISFTYEKEFIKHIENNKIVEAIKLLRNANGIGLKEAKDIADTVRNTLNDCGRCRERSPYALLPNELNSEYKKIYERIISAL